MTRHATRPRRVLKRASQIRDATQRAALARSTHPRAHRRVSLMAREMSPTTVVMGPRIPTLGSPARVCTRCARRYRGESRVSIRAPRRETSAAASLRIAGPRRPAAHRAADPACRRGRARDELNRLRRPAGSPLARAGGCRSAFVARRAPSRRRSAASRPRTDCCVPCGPAQTRGQGTRLACVLVRAPVTTPAPVQHPTRCRWPERG